MIIQGQDIFFIEYLNLFSEMLLYLAYMIFFWQCPDCDGMLISCSYRCEAGMVHPQGPSTAWLLRIYHHESAGR